MICLFQVWSYNYAHKADVQQMLAWGNHKVEVLIQLHVHLKYGGNSPKCWSSIKLKFNMLDAHLKDTSDRPNLTSINWQSAKI